MNSKHFLLVPLQFSEHFILNAETQNLLGRVLSMMQLLRCNPKGEVAAQSLPIAFIQVE